MLGARDQFITGPNLLRPYKFPGVFCSFILTFFLELCINPRPSPHFQLLNLNFHLPSFCRIPARSNASRGGGGLNMHEEAAAATGSPRLLNLHFDEDHSSGRQSVASSIASPDRSPYNMSPWHASASSPQSGSASGSDDGTSLVASLVREEGHIYSLAAVGDLLYTGSDSKNIRVWKNQTYFSGFKSTSGLVKAIVVAPGDHRIFTGHQDGKIRVWKVSQKNSAVHKRIGSLPKFKHLLKSSIKPSSYIDIRRHRTALWNKHADAISCLCFSEDHGLLYSGSWDKTFKIWRIADFKCLESVLAHDDAVNSMVAAFDGLVVTGSADGSVKVWRRELHGKGTSHSHTQTLIKQESAVTALAVSMTDSVLYAGSSDGVVNFWEGERHHTHGGVLRGHNMAVLCLAAAGSLVLSGSADNTICVWRREGGVHSCLSVLTGHGGPVKCLTVMAEEEDGGGATGSWILYSGSLDKSVKVWRVCEQPQEALLQGPQNIPVGPDGSEFICGGGAQSYDSSVGLEGNRTRVQAAA